MENKAKFCDYYQIKQCDGICGGLETLENYQTKIEQIVAILSGKTKLVEKNLQTKIEKAIQTQNYPLAALWRDRLKNLQRSVQDQKVVLPNNIDLDLFNLVIENAENETIFGSIFVQNIREGKIVNVGNFLLNLTFENQEKEEIAMIFWQRFLLGYMTLNANIAPIQLQTFWQN